MRIRSIFFNTRRKCIYLVAWRCAEKVPGDLNDCKLPCIKQIPKFRSYIQRLKSCAKIQRCLIAAFQNVVTFLCDVDASHLT